LTDGKVWASASLGQAPYTYSWSNNTTGDTLRNVGPGTYYLTVTDNLQCKVRDTVVVTEPTAIALTRVVTNATCSGVADGAIDVTVTGGTTNYSYAWSNAATTEDISNLSAGIYRPTVTDANGCTISATITVAEPNAMQLNVLEYGTTCSYTTNGEVEIGINGRTTPHAWVWSDGSFPLIRQGLVAGAYSISVTDANGCTATTTANVTSPAAISLSTTMVDVVCYGDSTGSITLSVANAVGGAAAADYLWSNGAQTQNNLNVAAGNYTITLTDQNQCTATTSATVNQPVAPLFLTSIQTYVLCYGAATGAIDLLPQGGTVPYSYNWSNGANSQDIANLVAGTYSVTVTDANSCSATLSAIVQQPADALTLTSTSVDASCFGFGDGSVDLTPTGAITPYTYTWSNSSTQEDPINLSAGSYSVTVTDNNGCTATHTAAVSQPTALQVVLQSTDIACHGDVSASITSTTTGGTPAYNYTWTNGAITEDINNLPAGTYTLTVTDRNLCTVNSSITITEPDEISFTYEVTDVTCFGLEDGYVTLSTQGGSGIINATWVGGVYPDNNLTGLRADNFTIILSDENGCDTSFAFNVSQPDSIFVNISPLDTLKVGQPDTIIAAAYTNPGVTSYLWEPSQGLSCTDCINPEVTAYYDTKYTLTVDNNGCTATDTVWVYVDGRIFYVPNAFSPNGDDQNDILYVYAEGVKKIIWSVYNRWGEVVFSSTDISLGWDGRLNGEVLQPGVFVIDIYIEFLDLTAQRKTQSVILLR
jgi:gliding motility-associated-like protein